jgi:alpha-L-fucosidase 2
VNQIVYGEPAKVWEEALPIGNGRLGGMVFGRIKQDHLQLNEDSIWYGGFRDRVNPDARKKLEEIQNLIFEGRIPEAEKMMEFSLSGVPNSQHPYQTAGELYLNWEYKEIPGQYRRLLDLDHGIVKVELAGENTSQTREYFASYEDQIIAIRVTSPKEDVSFSMHLERSRFYENAGKIGDDTIFIEGDLGKEGSSFLIAAKTEIKGGTMEVIGEQLRVTDAGEAVIYLAIETSFYHKEQWSEAAHKRLEQASERGYESVRTRHIQDYQKLAGKVSLKLSDSCETDGKLLLSAIRDETNERNRILQLRMTELYFQYGRYLLISSSRPGSQPANLQGIWNDSFQPCWDSKYTININTEMNYWPAETCGLSQCHLPLFDLLKRMHEKGKKVAEAMYGCRGFVAHHNTDLWGDCAPQDIYIPASYWTMGGAWLCTHIWTHYLYTRDEAFLREMYPILRDAVLFFEDFLVRRGEFYVTCPSVSPENTYVLQSGVKGSVCAGPSMDIQILRDLIGVYRKASAVLGESDELLQKAEEIEKRLPPIQIGRYGQIMEWQEDYEEEEPGHRHISQLYALHPSHQITVDKTPELAKAADRTLERRLSCGGGHTGWSCAWIINLYARLGKGDKAWEYLNKLWRDSTFPNFMDSHPMLDSAVFQIDGNFGAVSAISELLVQADEDRILLLPALPKAWSKGEVKGLCLPGYGTISIRWEKGQLVQCHIQCEGEMDTIISYQGSSIPLKLGKSEKMNLLFTDFCKDTGTTN